MGSIASRPKISVPAPISASTDPPASAVNPVITPDPQEIEKNRIEAVLRRGRSMAGNVMTSLRGVFDTARGAPVRKNLLGE